MSPVFAAQSASKKAVLAKGKKLADVIDGADLEHLGLFNWGTKDKAAINRALVELVGCQKVNDADPLQSELDPTLVPGGVIYLPEPWKPGGPLDVEKTHTFKLKKRLPMPAVAITDLPAWFTPGSGTTLPCRIKYRLEGLEVRADKTDVEIHVARYLDRQSESQSSYHEIISRRRDQKSADDAALLMMTQTEAENPTERVERECGTDGDKDTHIWRKHQDNVAPSPAVTETWEGDSQATKGILVAPAYINSTCAPYSVLVRYYKHKDDETASITFKESFYPRWKVARNTGTRTIDPDSLVVKWIVKHGKTPKLKHGQLSVIDKHNATICRVALDETKIAAEKLDLTALWPASAKRDDGPFRVQIQAHSGPDEPDGLALAVMPTQVRIYDYKQVQFLAFHVEPPSPYKGKADHDKDIGARCDAMIEAVQKAKTKSNAAEDILKIFMAPEFYFRGPEGAYPVEKIETIMPKLRVEADKIEYKDWMFVFGTAIGYQKHEDGGSELVHETPWHEARFSDVTADSLTVTPRIGKTAFIVPLVDWFLVQGTEFAVIKTVTEVVKYKKYTVTFDAGPAFSVDDAWIQVPAMDVIGAAGVYPALTHLLVKGRICERIPTTTAAARQWKVTQGTTSSAITECVRYGTTEDEFELTLDTPGAFETGPVELKEPKTTEITNVALVQKGYQSPYLGDRELCHAAVYKEYISHIDFKRKSGGDWGELDASEREIKVHYAKRAALPTFGSADIGSAFPNEERTDPTKTAGSEINKTGIGGGVVYTMDDITFGLEVCLDHGNDRLWNFYSGSTPQTVAGDPKVQILLIPSWGMSIGGGEVECPPSGPVFNVDGARGASVARLHDGALSCDDHPNKSGALNTTCNEPIRKYICPTCQAVGPSPGNCVVHTGTALEAWVTCVHSPRRACNAGCALGTRCGHPKTDPIVQCKTCKRKRRGGVSCGCVNPRPKPLVSPCDNSYKEALGACPDCTGTSIERCDEKFRKLGAPMTTTGAATHVPTATATYFDGVASVLAYNPVAIPHPDIV